MQTFALVEIELGSCHSFVPRNHLLYTLHVQIAGHKHRDPCPTPTGKRNSEQGRICPLISKPMEQGLQGEHILKKRQGTTPAGSTASWIECFLSTCTTAWGLQYRMLIYLLNSGWNLAHSKTLTKNRWPTLLKALDWSKLISHSWKSHIFSKELLNFQ